MYELGQPTSALLAAFSTPFVAICGCAAAVVTNAIAKIENQTIGFTCGQALVRAT
jgi:hypothetical protein